MSDKIVPLTPMEGTVEIIKGPGLIYEKISAIMADVGAISKDRKNTSQGYAFRGIDDFYNVLHPILAKHKVFSVPRVLETHHEERRSRKDNVLIYRIYTIEYIFYAEDGSHVSAVVVGEGMDSGDKAGNKAMAVAHKYALIQVFAIPTESNDDPENDSPEVGDPVYKGDPTATTKSSMEPSTDPTADAALLKLQNDFKAEVEKLKGEEKDRETKWFERNKSIQTTLQAKLNFLRQTDKLKSTAGDG